MEASTTVLSTSLEKPFIAWCFILNENILFPLIITYQKLFIFSVPVFCSHIYTLKLNLPPKIGLTYAIFIVKWYVFLIYIFYFSLLNLNLNIDVFKIYCENFRKKWTNVTCWKSASKYPTNFCIIYIHFSLWAKSENIWFF